MDPGDIFEVGNPRDEVEQKSDMESVHSNSSRDTDDSSEQPIVDDEARPNVNTLRCDNERAGAPPEARIPDAPGEGEEKEEEEEKISGSESADSQTIARFARARTANRKARSH